MLRSIYIPGRVPGFSDTIAFAGGTSRARSSSSLIRIPWFTFLFLFTVLTYICSFNITYSVQSSVVGDEALSLVDSVAEGNVYRRAALVILTVLSLALMQQAGARPLRLKGWMWVFVAASLAWIIVSPFWSDDPSLTIRRVVALLMFCFGALAVASRFSWREIVAFALFTSLLTLIISVFAEVWFGTFHPWYQGYRFSGVMHPNSQGDNCAVLVISAIAYSGMVPKKRNVLYSIAAIAFPFLILTKSRTATAAGAVGAIICLTLVAPKLRRLIIGFCFSGLTLSVLLFVFSIITNLNALGYLLSLGREEVDPDTQYSLTGRVPLWTYLFSYIKREPLLGFGYATFWTPERILEATSDQGWRIGSAHSGYIATVLCLGIPGLILLFAVLGTGIYESVKEYARTRMPGPAFALSILTLISLNMLTEQIVDRPMFVTFVCFVVLARLTFVRERGGATKAV